LSKPQKKSVAFKAVYKTGCRMISCGVPNSLQTRVLGEASSSKPHVVSQNHMFCQVLQFAFSRKIENNENSSSQT